MMILCKIVNCVDHQAHRIAYCFVPVTLVITYNRKLRMRRKNAYVLCIQINNYVKEELDG